MTNDTTDDLLTEVVTECLEHITTMEQLLLALEETADSPSAEVINSLFRSAHSIKGVTGFCGLNKIKDLSHVFENVLNAYRQGTHTPSTAAIDKLLGATDYLRKMLEDAANSEGYEIEEYLSSLSGILNEGEEDAVEEELPGSGAEAPEVENVPGELTVLTDSTGNYTFTVPQSSVRDPLARGLNLYIIRLDLLKEDTTEKRSPEEVLSHIKALGDIHESVFADPDAADEASPPAAVLFSSLIEPPMMASALEMATDRVEHLLSPEDLQNLFQKESATVFDTPTIPEEAAPSDPAPPVPETPAPAPPATPPKTKTAPRKATPEKKQTKPTPAPPVRSEEPAPAPPAQAEAAKSTATTIQSYLRVNVALLDKLMNLAGELVLGRNQLLQTTGTIGNPALMPVAQRIDMITSELQAEIMQTRMQELAAVFNKFPRLVRDLSRNLNKKVNLKIEGQEVELDKTIIEALGDPLVHIIRNSLDHGIETPETREKQGKAPEGTLEVRAYHEAGQVNIEIKDDGAGIDRDRLKDKAVRMGVITPAEAQNMSSQAALELIFRAGLSTAEQVSDVSGRGVGMDVVRSNLEKLGGILDIQSEVGLGTTTRIKLPLTMAIIPCLIVRLGKTERYAVPQINLTELVRVRTSELKQRIEKVGGSEVLRLRENLLPLVRLSDVLQATGYYRDPLTNQLKPDRRENIADRRHGETGPEAEEWREKRTGQERRQTVDAMNILVLSAGDLEYGLIVDELEDTEEIVVKPLGRHLKEIHSYAGATIMGDGRVAPILDVPGLAQQAELYRKHEAAQNANKAKGRGEESHLKKDMEKVLVFNHNPKNRFAVPIPLVARIERVETTKIESSLGHNSIQYRGSSLRLIMLDKHLPVEPLPSSDKVFIIVFEIGGHEIGVVASTLVDERLVPFNLDTRTHQRPGVMGSLIIDETTVMVIDIFELVILEEPDWLIKDAGNAEEKARRVLLVEDSEFFLNKVSGYLAEAGFEVLTATDGQKGLDVLEKETVDIILTDIEMPVMNGYEMVRRIRANPKYAQMPILALSSLAGDEDIRQGLAAGVDRYLIKLDRTGLIDSLMEFCG